MCLCMFLSFFRSNVDVESMTETLVREVKGMLRLSGMDQVMSIYFGGGNAKKIDCDGL